MDLVFTLIEGHQCPAGRCDHVQVALACSSIPVAGQFLAIALKLFASTLYLASQRPVLRLPAIVAAQQHHAIVTQLQNYRSARETTAP